MYELLVFLESSLADKGQLTLVARHGVLVLLQVSLVGRVTVEYLAALLTRRFLPGADVLVYLHVSDESALHSKSPGALAALEGLDAGVLPQVPRQLVRPREPPLAAVPGAPVRLLT